MPYRLSQAADKDLEDIYFYGLLTFGEAQSTQYLKSLYRMFDMLAEMPSLGRRSERGREDERRFPHGRHVIYFQETPDGIIINRLIAGRQILDIWGAD